MGRASAAPDGAPSQDRPEPRPTQTVERALSLLDALGAVDRPRSLTEVAGQTGLHVSTCLRLLRTLERAGYVERDGEGGSYRLGSKVFTLAHALERQLDIRAVARPILRALTEAVGEMSSLTVLDGAEVLLLERATSHNQLGIMSGVGARTPLYCTAAGKDLLAHADAELIERVLAGPLEPRTPTTITDPDALRAELARIRTAGFAIDDCEREPGLFGISAPVRDAAGRVIAAVGVSGPAERIKTADLPRTIARLQAAARDLSTKLGWIDPAGGTGNGRPAAATWARPHRTGSER